MNRVLKKFAVPKALTCQRHLRAKGTTLIMSLLWVLSSASLFAQDTELGKVIVTATGKKMKILDTNASISVITAKDIEESGKKTAGDLIGTIPGIINQKSGSGTKLSVRGTRPPGMAGGAIVIVDGVPLNNGLFDYSSIDLIPIDSIEKIEVIKSAPSSLYGKNVGKGVVVITTKKGKKQKGDEGRAYSIHGKASFEYGSWNTYSGFANVNGALSGFDYTLNATGMKSDGFRHTDHEDKSLGGSLGMDIDGGRLEWTANYIDTNYIYPQGFANKDDAEKYKRKINMPGKLGNDKESTFYTTGFNFRYDKNNVIANAVLTYGREDSKYDKKSAVLANPAAASDKKKKKYYKYDSVDHQYSGKANGGYRLLFGEDMVNTVNLGVDYNYETYEQDKTYPYIHSEDKNNDYDITRNNLGVNLNNDFSMGIFRLILGARYNNIKYKSKYDDSAPVEDFTRKIKNGFDYTISPSVTLIKDSNLFVTWNHTNVYTDMYKLAKNANNQGDASLPQVDDLDPEVFDSLEAGFKHQLMPALNYSIIAYRTKISDKLITFYKYNTATSKYESKGYYNAGDSVHQGIELEVDGRPHELIGYRLGFSTIKAEWEKIHPFENTSFGSMLIAVDLYGFSEQWSDDLNEKDNKKMEAAYFIDMKVQYDFQNFGAHVTCTNLMDKNWLKYAGSWYPQDGRYIGVGVSAKI